MRLLIKFPTRGRPQQFVRVLQQYLAVAGDKENLKILVTLDEDDTTATPAFVNYVQRLHSCIQVIVGKSEGKVHAINRDMPDPSTFDILLLASDDMVPVVSMYDMMIRDSMEQFFPDTDGVLFYNDGYVGSLLNTLVICGSKYYARFGYIYHPAYKSLFCDNEFMTTAERLQRQVYLDYVIIKHEHPANNQTVHSDALYQVNDKHWAHDEAVWRSRHEPLFDMSILICTKPERQEMLTALLHDIEIFKQRTSLRVEVLTDARTDLTIGRKRSQLLYKAKGIYCAFVDDDDKITPAYFEVIEEALKSGEDYDCIQLNGRFYERLIFRAPFVHSLKYTAWSQDNTQFYRMPNHLNPIKTELARKVGFQDKSFQEDHIFALRLQAMGLLKKEYTHDKVQYLYYFDKVDLTVNNFNLKQVGTGNSAASCTGPTRPAGLTIIQRR